MNERVARNSQKTRNKTLRLIIVKKEFRLTDQTESSVIYHVAHREHTGKAKLLLSTEPRAREGISQVNHQL